MSDYQLRKYISVVNPSIIFGPSVIVGPSVVVALFRLFFICKVEVYFQSFYHKNIIIIRPNLAGLRSVFSRLNVFLCVCQVKAPNLATSVQDQRNL